MLCKATRGSRRKSSPLRARGIDQRRSWPSWKYGSAPLNRGEPSLRTVPSTALVVDARIARTRSASSGSTFSTSAKLAISSVCLARVPNN